MKGKVKKNQLIIVALAVMIAAAGYLNYTGRLFGENAKGTKEANADLTNQELLDISQEDTEAGSEEIESKILKQKEHLERRFSQMVQPRLR